MVREQGARRRSYRLPYEGRASKQIGDCSLRPVRQSDEKLAIANRVVSMAMSRGKLYSEIVTRETLRQASSR